MDSVTAGFIQSKDEYRLGANDSEEALKLNIGKRKKITMIEGMTLYKVLGANKFNKVGQDTWNGIVRQGYLPERSVDSMKNFWKEYSTKTLEQYLVESIFNKWDYCLSFKEIPNEEFEAKHRQQFAFEFQQLEQQQFHDSYTHNQDGPTPTATYRPLDMEESSSDDDVFGDNVTAKLDELNKQNKEKFSALDTLASPGGVFNLQADLNEGRSTMLASG